VPHRRWIVPFALLAVVVAIGVATIRGGGDGGPAPDDSYWGAWIGSQLTGSEAPWDMSAVTKFEAMTGKGISLLEFSSPFSDCGTSPCTPYSFPTTPFEDIRAHGAIPVFSWSSQSIPSSTHEPAFQLADIIDGRYDSYIRSFAVAAREWGHPFFLRFDWEMNGDWFPWSERTNGNGPGQYVAAWRHVHDIFTAVGATNATWVWCPYVDPGATLQPLSQLYPGNAYVDWTCLDGYNWGPDAKRAEPWRSFATLFRSSYRQITETIAPTKPMLIAETASSEKGGSKAAWIEAMFAALPVQFPRVRGLIWFENVSEGMDWPIETSAASREAFAAGIDDPRYLGDDYRGLSTSPIPAPP